MQKKIDKRLYVLSDSLLREPERMLNMMHRKFLNGASGLVVAATWLDVKPERVLAVIKQKFLAVVEDTNLKIRASLIQTETMCIFSWLPRGQFVERAPPEGNYQIIH